MALYCKPPSEREVVSEASRKEPARLWLFNVRGLLPPLTREPPKLINSLRGTPLRSPLLPEEGLMDCCLISYRLGIPPEQNVATW